MRLTGTMIWVLTQNHDLHLVERREVEGVENQRSRGIDGVLPFLAHQKRFQVSEIGCLELRSQHLIPAFINIGFLYFHIHKISAKMVIIREKIRYFASQIT